ncbi:MAG TPA: hypothetical protein VF855_14870 [Acidimicrobiales bacterium]
MLPQAELVALHRSTAMLPPGQRAAIDRDALLELCEELMEARALLGRLGTDLRAVARRAPRD